MSIQVRKSTLTGAVRAADADRLGRRVLRVVGAEHQSAVKVGAPAEKVAEPWATSPAKARLKESFFSTAS